MSHDDRIRQLTDLFIDDLRGPIDASLRQLLSQMMEMATQEEATAIAQARQEEVAATQAALDALRAELEQRHDEALRTAADQHHDRLQTLREQLVHDHEAAIAALQEGFAEERAAAAQAARDEVGGDRDAALAALRATLEQEHETALARLRDGLVQEQDAALAAHRDQAAQVLEAAVHDARAQSAAAAEGEIDALRRERDAARATVAELTDRLAAAHARQEHLTDLADAESVAADQSLANGASVQADERQAGLACSDRLLGAIRRLDEAQTLTDVLAALADHVGSTALRTAVLLVQGDRLRGWRVAGMGQVSASDLDLPLDHSGILGRAVATALPVSSSGSYAAGGEETQEADLPAFLLPPAEHVGFALPVLVGGRVVAVLYADDATGEEPVVPSDWPEIVEVVVRHAGRCLESLTLARAHGFGVRPVPEARPSVVRPTAASPAPADRPGDEAQEEESARRHARLLISEIKLYNESLVEQGRREGTLLQLLGAEIERARRLYEEKIPAAVRERVNCFDDEIVRTLAGGDRAVLGQIR